MSGCSEGRRQRGAGPPGCFGEGHEGRHPVGVWEWWDGDSSPIKGNRGDSLDSRKTRKGQGAS